MTSVSARPVALEEGAAGAGAFPPHNLTDQKGERWEAASAAAAADPWPDRLERGIAAAGKERLFLLLRDYEKTASPLRGKATFKAESDGTMMTRPMESPK